MRAGVPKKTLAEAAGVLERIAPTKPSQPVLAHLYLEGVPEGLLMRATNGEVDLELLVPAEVEGTGAALVPAALFGQLVRSLPAEHAELRLTPEGLELEGGSFSTRIATADPETFPPFPEPEGAEGKLSAEALAKALSRVRYAAAQEEYRAIFRGIQLEFGEHRFRAVATDGFRLALFDVAEGPGFEAKRVLPARNADELVRLIKDLAVPLSLSVGEARLWAKGERFRVALALMEGSFPDYERVIPDRFVLEAVLDAEALRQAIERLRVLADRQSQRIDVAFSETGLELVAEGELGRGRELLAAEVQGEAPLVAAFNAQYLADALKGLKGPVHFRLSGPTTPSLIESEEEPGYRAVVVPLRV